MILLNNYLTPPTERKSSRNQSQIIRCRRVHLWELKTLQAQNDVQNGYNTKQLSFLYTRNTDLSGIFGCKTGRTYTGCPKKEGECEYRLVEQEEWEKKKFEKSKKRNDNGSWPARWVGRKSWIYPRTLIGIISTWYECIIIWVCVYNDNVYEAHTKYFTAYLLLHKVYVLL